MCSVLTDVVDAPEMTDSTLSRRLVLFTRILPSSSRTASRAKAHDVVAANRSVAEEAAAWSRAAARARASRPAPLSASNSDATAAFTCAFARQNLST